ncbi:MAG: hypothetical protein WB626_01900 [Bacteroidota bacterium]
MKQAVAACAAFLLVLPASPARAQEGGPLGELREAYGSFEYGTAVRLADVMLAGRQALGAEILLEVFLLKGMSHFSLGEEDSARAAFLQMLDLDVDYRPDSVLVSPKIITFFERVRGEHLRAWESPRPAGDAEKDTSARVSPGAPAPGGLSRGAVARSLLLPGLGHFSAGNETKGWVLTAASGAVLGSLAYFVLRTNSLEREYLGESNPAFIAERYDRYNAAYRTRNILLVAYAALFTYAQADLLLAETAQGTSLSLRAFPAEEPRLLAGLRCSF